MRDSAATYRRQIGVATVETRGCDPLDHVRRVPVSWCVTHSRTRHTRLMVASCHRSRAACVVDTLHDALHANEFTSGLRAGLVAVTFTVAIGLVWWRVRRHAPPLPIAGLAAVVASAYALRDATGFPDRVLFALGL